MLLQIYEKNSKKAHCYWTPDHVIYEKNFMAPSCDETSTYILKYIPNFILCCGD